MEWNTDYAQTARFRSSDEQRSEFNSIGQNDKFIAAIASSVDGEDLDQGVSRSMCQTLVGALLSSYSGKKQKTPEDIILVTADRFAETFHDSRKNGAAGLSAVYREITAGSDSLVVIGNAIVLSNDGTIVEKVLQTGNEYEYSLDNATPDLPVNSYPCEAIGSVILIPEYGAVASALLAAADIDAMHEIISEQLKSNPSFIVSCVTNKVISDIAADIFHVESTQQKTPQVRRVEPEEFSPVTREKRDITRQKSDASNTRPLFTKEDAKRMQRISGTGGPNLLVPVAGIFTAVAVVYLAWLLSQKATPSQAMNQSGQNAPMMLTPVKPTPSLIPPTSTPEANEIDCQSVDNNDPNGKGLKVRENPWIPEENPDGNVVGGISKDAIVRLSRTGIFDAQSNIWRKFKSGKYAGKYVIDTLDGTELLNCKLGG
jgi:hypothetical protein